jgi:hypothetical protein
VDQLLGETAFAKRLKEPGNFFKHASRVGDDVIEFNPSLSEGFILFAIMGMGLCGERATDEEVAYNYWIMIHDPDLLTEEGRKSLTNNVPIENLRLIKRMGKKEFFNCFITARRLLLSKTGG